jgi:hypothetical protein
MSIKILFASTALALAALGAQAQSSDAAATPRIDRREANQEQRIQQGVGSGQLTARETYRLEKEQVAINRAEVKAKSDGKVAAQERRHLTKMQNRASRDIYRQKHDAQVAPKS